MTTACDSCVGRGIVRKERLPARGAVPNAKRCMARVPPHLYKSRPTRCEKPARVKFQRLILCSHHHAKALRGGLEVWEPAAGGR
jgi:hypothetical protein